MCCRNAVICTNLAKRISRKELRRIENVSPSLNHPSDVPYILLIKFPDMLARAIDKAFMLIYVFFDDITTFFQTRRDIPTYRIKTTFLVPYLRLQNFCHFLKYKMFLAKEVYPKKPTDVASIQERTSLYVLILPS